MDAFLKAVGNIVIGAVVLMIVFFAIKWISEDPRLQGVAGPPAQFHPVADWGPAAPIDNGTCGASIRVGEQHWKMGGVVYRMTPPESPNDQLCFRADNSAYWKRN